MLTPQDTFFVLVDVQGRLAELMAGKETLFANLEKLILGMQALDIPIAWLEQNPERMGPTIARLQALLGDYEPIAKMSFSCCGEDAFMERIRGLQRKQALLAGIEAHVCVYQTAVDLAGHGYEVQVAADAVSSRVASNRDIGLRRIREAGATLTSVEMALFELMRTATHPAFRDILKIVR
jgi:nicotinamidase-related amidase